jgi:GntR family transcriptional regulator
MRCSAEQLGSVVLAYRGRNAFAEEEQGHTLGRFTEDVSARMPTPREARLLTLSPGVSVFRLIRTAYDMDGRAVEVCDTVMAADVYQLSYELPAR